jgi:hypothetical protein
VSPYTIVAILGSRAGFCVAFSKQPLSVVAGVIPDSVCQLWPPWSASPGVPPAIGGQLWPPLLVHRVQGIVGLHPRGFSIPLVTLPWDPLGARSVAAATSSMSVPYMPRQSRLSTMRQIIHGGAIGGGQILPTVQRFTEERLGSRRWHLPNGATCVMPCCGFTVTQRQGP